MIWLWSQSLKWCTSKGHQTLLAVLWIMSGHIRNGVGCEHCDKMTCVFMRAYFPHAEDRVSCVCELEPKLKGRRWTSILLWQQHFIQTDTWGPEVSRSWQRKRAGRSPQVRRAGLLGKSSWYLFMCVVGLWLKRLKLCPFERLHLDYWGTPLVCDEPRATTKPELIKNAKRSPTRIERPLNRVWFDQRLIFHWNKFNFLKALSPLRVW